MCLLFFLFFSSWWMAQDHSSWKCKNHPRCLHFPHCKHLIDAKSSRPYFSACDSLDLYYWYYMYRSISIHGLEYFHSLPIVLSYSIPIPHPYSRLFIMWLRPFQLYFFLLLYPISLFCLLPPDSLTYACNPIPDLCFSRFYSLFRACTFPVLNNFRG